MESFNKKEQEQTIEVGGSIFQGSQRTNHFSSKNQHHSSFQARNTENNQFTKPQSLTELFSDMTLGEKPELSSSSFEYELEVKTDSFDFGKIKLQADPTTGKFMFAADSHPVTITTLPIQKNLAEFLKESSENIGENLPDFMKEYNPSLHLLVEKLQSKGIPLNEIFIQDIQIDGPSASVGIGTDIKERNIGGNIGATAASATLRLLHKNDQNPVMTEIAATLNLGFKAGAKVNPIKTKNDKQGFQQQKSVGMGAWSVALTTQRNPDFQYSENDIKTVVKERYKTVEATSSSKLSRQQKQTLNKFLSDTGIKKNELDKPTQHVLAEILEQQQKSITYFLQQRQSQIEGYQGLKQFVNHTQVFSTSIKELGGLTKCKKLELIGDIAEKSMSLSKATLKIGEALKFDMPAMLGGLGQSLSGITGFLGAAFPVVSGIVSIVSVMRSVFRRKKSKGDSGGDNGIAQAFQAIFNQLVELRKEVHELRKEVHELRKEVQELRKEVQELRKEVQEFRIEVLDKLIEISRYLANDFKAPVMAELQIIKDDLNFIATYLTNFFAISKFDQLEKSISFITKNIQLQEYKQAKNLVMQLGSDLAIEATSPNHNGVTMFNSFKTGDSFYRQTNEMLKREFVSHNIHFGFLYQVYQRERQPDNPSVQADNLPNLVMFNYLLNNYLKFTAQPKLTHLVTHEELQKFKEIPVAVKTFIQTVRQDEEFILQLEANYKQTLAKIEHVVNTEISNMDSSSPQTTVADVFRGKGTEKTDLDPLLAKADYYQSLIYIFGLLTGDRAAIIRNLSIFETQQTIQNYPVLRQIQAATPDEWEDYLHTDPAYYETLQVGKFTQDGIEKIYLAVRDKDGLDLKFYEPNTNEWEQAPRGPLWSDADGFKECCYYQTLRSTVATVDGEDRIYFLMRRRDGLSLQFYSTQRQRWSQATTERTICSIDPSFNQQQYSLPIQLGTTVSQSIFFYCYAGDGYYKFYNPEKNIWQTHVSIGWGGAKDSNFNTISSYRSYKISSSGIKNDTVILSSRYTDGRQYLTEQFPQNWEHLAVMDPKITNPDYHKNPEIYRVFEMALLKINDSTEFFYFLHRKKQGLIVSRIVDLYQPTRRYDQTSSDLNAFSNDNGFDQENNAASIKMLPITLGNQQKLLVIGQSKQGLLMFAVDPISLKWQALPLSNIFSVKDSDGNLVDLFDKSAAESLRAITVTLTDGSQELFLAAITREGLINYRYPLSIKPLINYLNSTLSIADALVNTQTVSPIEEQVYEMIAKLNQRIAEKNNPSVQTENQPSAQDTAAVCIDDECSPSTERKLETQNNAGLRYSFELETEKHVSQTSNSNQLKPGLLSTLSTAAYSFFQWIPRSLPSFVQPIPQQKIQPDTQSIQLDATLTDHLHVAVALSAAEQSHTPVYETYKALEQHGFEANCDENLTTCTVSLTEQSIDAINQIAAEQKQAEEFIARTNPSAPAMFDAIATFGMFAIAKTYQWYRGETSQETEPADSILKNKEEERLLSRDEINSVKPGLLQQTQSLMQRSITLAQHENFAQLDTNQQTVFFAETNETFGVLKKQLDEFRYSDATVGDLFDIRYHLRDIRGYLDEIEDECARLNTANAGLGLQ